VNDGCSSTSDPVEKIAKTISTCVESDDYLAELCVLFKRAFGKESECPRIQPMQRHDALKVRRWETKTFKCYLVSHCCCSNVIGFAQS
jgi:hypothetical protein